MQLSHRFALAAGIVLLAGCASTAPTETPGIAANQPTDNQLTCPQITGQINEMNEILGISEGEMRSAQTMGLATDVAVNAAVYSGAAGSMAGSVPFLGQAISAAGQVARMNEEQAERYAEQALARRNVLTGIYAGKGCAD